MKKFLALLKKEIRDLITPQMIVPMILAVAAFSLIGKVVGGEIQKNIRSGGTLVVCDQDGSSLSLSVTDAIGQTGMEVIRTDTPDHARETAMEKGTSVYAVIPPGFENGILESKSPQKIELISILKSVSISAAISSGKTGAVIDAFNKSLSDMLLHRETPVDPEFLKEPVRADEYILLG
ncbi:MAG TPA: hypothetical protein DD727_01990, partial [Clostridiales bacterium]|nr:hypothetical protein [Clostridiales bacterium]